MSEQETDGAAVLEERLTVARGGARGARVSGGDIIPGTFVVGAVGSGRASLVRATCAKLFVGDEQAALIYIGAADDAARLKGKLPAERIAGAGVSLISAATQRQAHITGYTNEEISRAGADYVLLSAAKSSQERARRPAFILAVDGLAQIARRNAAGFLLSTLTTAFTTPGACRPIIGVRAYEEIEELFGADGIALFMRFEQTYILRTENDFYSQMLLSNSTVETPAELRNGQALLITQSYDAVAGSSLLTDEFLDVPQV